jgi:hypothetical protein
VSGEQHRERRAALPSVAEPSIHWRGTDRRYCFGRIYQTDIRFSRTIRTGRTTVRPTVSVYNLFNSNAVQTYTNTYGLAWQAPQTIMQSRFVDIGVQVDF